MLHACVGNVRRLLIEHIGREVVGLNSLYTSVIGMLSVVELGVGSAIVYSMYKPIIEGRLDAVAALYQLFRKAYAMIGALILVVGVALVPLLPTLIND